MVCDIVVFESEAFACVPLKYALLPSI
jgi:hypothetical protein